MKEGRTLRQVMDLIDEVQADIAAQDAALNALTQTLQQEHRGVGISNETIERLQLSELKYHYQTLVLDNLVAAMNAVLDRLREMSEDAQRQVAISLQALNARSTGRRMRSGRLT